MIKSRRPTARACLPGLLLVVLGAVVPAGAVTMLRSEELPALVHESRRAVLATVTGLHFDKDEQGLHATYVRLRVEDRLYGEEVPAPGGEFTIKLYGSPEVMRDGTRVFLDGTPRYTIGQRYLLLLKDDTPWGFTNVSGLFQGAFEVRRQPGGPLLAESLAGNRRVLRKGGVRRWLSRRDVTVEEAAYLDTTDGPLPYSLLRKTVMRLRLERSAR